MRPPGTAPTISFTGCSGTFREPRRAFPSACHQVRSFRTARVRSARQVQATEVLARRHQARHIIMCSSCSRSMRRSTCPRSARRRRKPAPRSLPEWPGTYVERRHTLVSSNVSRKRSILRSLLAVACLLFIANAQPRTGTSSAGLYYEVSGAGDPVVLIHGFSIDRRMWDPQMPALQGRFTVIRYDQRGHGKSAPPSSPYSTSDDLRSVLDAVDVRRAALVGLSAGAQVATDFALAYPDRVTRLVLTAPGVGGMAMPPLPWMQPVLQAATAGEPERAASLWAETPIMTLRSDTSAAATPRELVMSNSRV